MNDISSFQAVVLGIVQGLTEFLPVSSSGHLRIVPALLGWPDPGAAFTAIIQLGTMTAVLIYFWRDIYHIATTWTRSLVNPSLRGELDARIGWYIVLGTIPISVVGLVGKSFVEGAARNLWLIASTLILLGLLLALAEKLGRRSRALRNLTLRDGMTVGCAQALALVPGVSRSGSTITAGLLLGFTREAAARFSFLLSLPAVVLSGLFEMRHLGEGGLAVIPTVVATVLAFVSGYASIAWLLRFLTAHSTVGFVIYRVALGGSLLVLLSLGAVTAT